jgi:hypothetical protein
MVVDPAEVVAAVDEDDAVEEVVLPEERTKLQFRLLK